MNERFKLWGCVLALIIRDNKILMILRKNKPDAGNFNLVGGRMEENETVSLRSFLRVCFYLYSDLQQVKK